MLDIFIVHIISLNLDLLSTLGNMDELYMSDGR